VLSSGRFPASLPAALVSPPGSPGHAPLSRSVFRAG